MSFNDFEISNNWKRITLMADGVEADTIAFAQASAAVATVFDLSAVNVSTTPSNVETYGSATVPPVSTRSLRSVTDFSDGFFGSTKPGFKAAILAEIAASLPAADVTTEQKKS